MFTGIIETVGTISGIRKSGSNVDFTIHSDISKELKIDQSVCHDGVCLTIVETGPDYHIVTAVQETLERSILGDYKTGVKVNLERSMLSNGRFDGHVVQGHVDQVGVITSVEEQDGSWLYHIEHGKSEHMTVEKGSITVNGISLTCFGISDSGFTVAIIPYTHEHTNLGNLQTGDKVNLEFDIIGKYVQRMLGDRSVNDLNDL